MVSVKALIFTAGVVCPQCQSTSVFIHPHITHTIYLCFMALFTEYNMSTNSKHFTMFKKEQQLVPDHMLEKIYAQARCKENICRS